MPPVRLTTSLAAALLSAGAIAHADPVQVEVSGDCPTRAQLEAALALEDVAVVPAARWIVEIRSSDGRAELSMRHLQADATRRRIESDDCAAVAEAFALIIATALEAPRPAPPIIPPGDTARVERRSPPPARRDLGLSIGLSGGLEIAADHGRPGFWELDGTLRAGSWRLRLAASAARWAGSQSIERRQRLARLEIGTELGGRGFWLRPLGGLSLAMTTVRSSPSTGVEVTRLHPALSASLVGGIELTGAVSLRAEAGVLGFPIADRYLTDMGVAGESPRVQLRLGAGLEFRTRM